MCRYIMLHLFRISVSIILIDSSQWHWGWGHILGADSTKIFWSCQSLSVLYYVSPFTVFVKFFITAVCTHVKFERINHFRNSHLSCIYFTLHVCKKGLIFRNTFENWTGQTVNIQAHCSGHMTSAVVLIGYK